MNQSAAPDLVLPCPGLSLQEAPLAVQVLKWIGSFLMSLGQTKEDSKPFPIIGHHWTLPIELVVVVVERIGECTTNSSIDARASSRKSCIEPVPKIINLMTASIHVMNFQQQM